jgi:replication-associated recombination protein RarA
MVYLNDCFIPQEIQEYLHFHLENENFLLIGTSGTGKTTILNAMSNHMNSGNNIFNIKPQELNVQWIRSQLIPRVKSQSQYKKIMIIDEIDLILESSQHLLASILEETNTLLYASCCDPHKVISALRNQIIHIRIPLLSGNRLDNVIKVMYYNHFGKNPSFEIIEKIRKYSDFNLKKIQNSIYILEDCDINQSGNCFQENIENQSLIDTISNQFSEFEKYDTATQIDLLPKITIQLIEYYEKQFN